MSGRISIAVSVLVLVLFAVLLEAAGAQAHSAQKPGMTSGPMMGPMRTISEHAFLGFYDGKKFKYLSTDISNKAEAATMHVNYSAAIGRVKGSPAMYLLEGRAAPGQLAAFGSKAGAPDYSPLWEEMIVKWKAGVKPTLLTSDNSILALQKKGKLTVTDSHVVMNCPFVK